MSCNPINIPGGGVAIVCTRGPARYVCDIPPHDDDAKTIRAVARCADISCRKDLCGPHRQEHFDETGHTWKKLR